VDEEEDADVPDLDSGEEIAAGFTAGDGATAEPVLDATATVAPELELEVDEPEDDDEDEVEELGVSDNIELEESET
jgi:hypothetical protein